MWKPGDIVAWREVFRGRVWHALSFFVVQDAPHEIVIAAMPGAERMVETHYPQGKNNGRRRWDFKFNDWRLERFPWHTTRGLQILEPGKFFSTSYFWDHASSEFLFYYINFQLPFSRNDHIIDTLDLDLDMVIKPDFSFEWKDLDDYQKAREAGLILPEWIAEIETAKEEVLERLERHDYPLDGSWLNWRPDPDWPPPTLPDGWDKT